MEPLIFNQTLAGPDWGFQQHQFVSYQQALQHPFRIAALMVFFDDPNWFCYDKEIENLDFSNFDLILLTSIEPVNPELIIKWAAAKNFKNYLLAVGATEHGQSLPDNVVYRPWWAFNVLKLNSLPSLNLNPRRFNWECLLGARRPHRDYAMLAFQHFDLLDQNIVNYRDFFAGGAVDHQSEEFAQIFSDQNLKWPYVSPNLEPNWEVRDSLDKSISPFVPWKIYENCNYSLVCETLGTGHCFFLSEKTGKALYGHRLFVSVSNSHFLEKLHVLGFETFGSVIDESYDNNELDFDRFRQVFEQVQYLNKQNPKYVLEKVAPILQHNHHRLLSLREEKRKKMQEMLQENVKFS